MESFYYAQLDNNNVVMGISSLTGKVDKDDMILLTEEEYMKNLIGYTYKNGEWIPAKTEENISQETILEELKENQVILMSAMAEMFESKEE